MFFRELHHARNGTPAPSIFALRCENSDSESGFCKRLSGSLNFKNWSITLQSRVEYLDGLRGVAILLVLAFHSYSRWPEIVPYGNAYKDFPLFQLGWLGVELFFLISGFVIFMTLDKTKSFGTFIYKRWLRLFPAMLLASVMIYFTAPLFYERPAGSPDLLDMIPGLTFIEPAWWSKLLGTQIKPLEGAFWSLYVEFKFYVLAGLIYYFLGRKLLVPVLLFLFLSSITITEFQTENNMALIKLITTISKTLSFKYFGWFCAGALFYLYQQTKNEGHYLMAIGVAALSSVNTGDHLGANAAALMITGLFALSLRVTYLQHILTSKFFMLFGFVSYPLYLIHENSMISMIVKSQTLLPQLDMFFYPIPPIALLTTVSFFIAKVFEPKTKLAVETAIQSILNKTLPRTN